MIRQLIRELLSFEELKSPLVYQKDPNVKRLSLVDTESPEFKKLINISQH